ncbi:DUF3142 domain-containing protein [Thermodesulfobacteriota bacterium]
MDLLNNRIHVNSIFVRGVAILAILVATLSVFLNLSQSIQWHQRPLSNEIYIWNYLWNEKVSNILKQAAPQTSRFLALSAEVLWKTGQASVKRVPIDYNALKATKKPVGLCLRIEQYAGPFERQDEATTLLIRLATSLIAEANTSGVKPAEFQIDFDCAESKLDGYRKWIEVLRPTIHPTPLTITALPCWMKHKTFIPLACATDGYVLQVHSLSQQNEPKSPFTLCDKTLTRQWVEQAARIGVPFRVALPTYGYLLTFDKNGRFIGRQAESPSRAWIPGATYRTVFADPCAMSRLVRTWKTDRPACMKGITWFRLPVEGDRMNWSWITLSAVMAGQVPDLTVAVKVEYPVPELAEIILINTGNTDLYPAVNVQIEWEQGKRIAADGLRGFVLTATKHANICLQPDKYHTLERITPGDSWKIGWIRFEQETKVNSIVTFLKT